MSALRQDPTVAPPGERPSSSETTMIASGSASGPAVLDGTNTRRPPRPRCAPESAVGAVLLELLDARLQLLPKEGAGRLCRNSSTLRLPGLHASG